MQSEVEAPVSGPKARHVIAWAGASAASEGPGNRSQELPQGLKGRHIATPLFRSYVLPLQGIEICLGMFTWGFTPGYHMTGFQPSEQRRIVSEVDALQAKVEALKRLHTETAADPPSFYFGATWLDALLTATSLERLKAKR